MTEEERAVQSAVGREEISRLLTEHQCWRRLLGRLSHRHWMENGQLMPTCERCGTPIDNKHNEVGPICWTAPAKALRPSASTLIAREQAAREIERTDLVGGGVADMRAVAAAVVRNAALVPSVDPSASAGGDELREALEPFLSFGAREVDEIGWKHPPMRERVVDWFGPSDFRKLAAALSAKPTGGEDRAVRLKAASPVGVVCPACDGEPIAGCICGGSGRIYALTPSAPSGDGLTPCDLHPIFSKACGHCLDVNDLTRTDSPSDRTPPTAAPAGAWSKPEYAAADEARQKALSEDPNDQMSALAVAVDAALAVAATKGNDAGLRENDKPAEKLSPLFAAACDAYDLLEAINASRVLGKTLDLWLYETMGKLATGMDAAALSASPAPVMRCYAGSLDGDWTTFAATKNGATRASVTFSGILSDETMREIERLMAEDIAKQDSASPAPKSEYTK